MVLGKVSGFAAGRPGTGQPQLGGLSDEVDSPFRVRAFEQVRTPDLPGQTASCGSVPDFGSPAGSRTLQEIPHLFSPTT